MKAVVTGSEGFVGKHLVQHLSEESWEVKGFNERNGQDIRNYEQVRNFLDAERPDAVFHLAAQAFVPESFSSPQRTFEVNTIGSTNILEAVRQLGIKTTVHLAGTSEEYGDGVPREDTLPEPKSPYAISKLAMDYMGQLYAKSYGLHVVVTRAFNHTGPGRGEMYAESSFAKQIVKIERGQQQTLEHGNLGSVRNYTDVRDIVRAYALAPTVPSGVYNLCSNQNVTMQQVLAKLIGKAKCRVETHTNPALYRPSDFSFRKPSSKKFRKLTGWKPEIELDETLEEILHYWRQR